MHGADVLCLERQVAMLQLRIAMEERGINLFDPQNNYEALTARQDDCALGIPQQSIELCRRDVQYTRSLAISHLPEREVRY